MQIPEGVTFNVSGQDIMAKGPAGEVGKKLPEKVQVKVNGKEIEVICAEKPLKNTFEAHVRNMLKGAKEGYKFKMKVVFAHFPITAEVKGENITIKNLGGEKVPRKTKVVGKTKVEVKGQEIFISGPDKDAVGQTVANIRNATKMKNKDHRIFQDGYYVVS
jgi:large subunit ribosomal protein L6